MEKEDKLKLVGFTVIHDYVKTPHKKLNIKSIAKKCQVSRAWIYKYFGSSQEEILICAIDSRATDLAAVPDYGKKLDSKREWVKYFLHNLEFTLSQVEKYPEVLQLYYYSHLYPSVYSERFKFHEQRLLEKVAIPAIRQCFQYSHAEAKSMAEMIHTLRMGICFKWLNEKNRTPALRQKLVQTVKSHIFGHTKA